MSGPFELAVSYVAAGGPFAYANLAILAGALALIGQRLATVAFRPQWPAAPFMEQIGKLVRVGNVTRALKLCRAAPPHVPLPKVIRAGLERADAGEGELAQALAEALRVHTAPLLRRLRWLVVLAQVAAVVGLVGAAVALLTAGERTPETAEAVLAPSLSRALASGSFGLGVALVCLAIRSSLAGEAEAAVVEAEQGARELERLLSREGTPERGATGS